jgi:MFS transporter, DHA1 family, multidrug resistance protein
MSAPGTPANTLPTAEPGAARIPPSLPHAALAVALFLGLQPIITDLYLPALPALAQDLAAPMPQVQLTMSAFILAFGLMQLVWGPLSDRHGRRPVLLASLSILLAASVVAALAGSIGALIVARAAQGAAAAAVVMCARAIVRDLYEPAQGARVMSLGLSGLGVLAIAGPIAGGLLAAQWGWRGALTAVAACVAVVLLFAWRTWPETIARPDPEALQMRVLLRNAAAVWAHPTFRAWALLVSCTYAALFVILSASSFVFIRQLGLSPAAYGAALASGSLSYLVGTFVCRRWLAQHGLAGTVRRGGWFSLAGGLGMGACAVLGTDTSLALLLLSQWLFAFGHGIHQPCGQAGAVGPFPHAAGVASAWAGCCLALVAFAVGSALGWAMLGQDVPVRVLGGFVAFWACATTLVAWTLVQRHGHAR